MMLHTREELEHQIGEQIDFEKLNVLCEHLKDAIREIFNSCGLYFRIFARVKTPESIANKIIRGEYGTAVNPRKLQDLIGLRVVLYYYDDLSICRDIMEGTFQMLDSWSKTNYNADEFKAAKINGVFKFPSEYFKSYTRTLWDLPIDTTFEMQFRTVFFEGWHEIEHDMRYKSLLTDEQFWNGSEELSRILNCVLANLELSDWSLVQLFEQLSYNHYKNANWELMLKTKFRIKMDDGPGLDTDILAVFDRDKEVAKLFFKCSRNDLIRELLKLDNPHVTYNLIIKALNERTVYNEEIARICSRLTIGRGEHSFQRTILARLETYVLFHLEIPLLHKPIRHFRSEYNNSVNIIYKWARFKLNPVFEDMPAELCSYQNHLPGYELKIAYHPEEHFFSMKLHYIDSQQPGTIWNMETSIQRKEDQKLNFNHVTSCDTPHGATQRATFSKPSFISDISNKVGLIDEIRLGQKAHFIENTKDYDNLLDFLYNPKRRLPAIVITQCSPQNSSSDSEYKDGYDMNTFPINGTRLAKVIGLYSHVFMMDRCFSEGWAGSLKLSLSNALGSILLFWPGTSPKTELFTQKMVFDTQFDFNRFAFHDQNIYEKAFRHKLVQIIKDDNTSH